MPQFTLTKTPQQVADSLSRLVKNGEQITEIVERMDQPQIAVVGDVAIFDPHELDLWSGRIKFVLIDNQPSDDESREARGWLAMQAPELAQLMTARTLMRVYRWETETERVTTIREVIRNGRAVSKQEAVAETPVERWVEVTEEFAKLARHQEMWG